ncbi:MAG TPA: tetratricopeptide repeat protein, partial [Noviherbaspirillum sp.]|uniref:nuclear transport factor 2 family protein n=1 Tax=Noviherbaspirillum sp. TaxID=1926288 RepID=UPI002DDD2B46
LYPAFKRTLAVSIIAAALSGTAIADDSADVGRLMRSGQYTEAMSKVEASLAKNPRDAQMRFMKGVILTEQNKSADAITVFTKLTEDFPSLPEPYNNLAVLYAANGQYDKARAALDAAIRTNPSYATAYENLGDVHAKLASQAYDKAFQLDSANSTAKSKLTLVRTLVAGGNGTANSNAANGTPANTAKSAAPAAPASVPPVATTQKPAAEPPKVAMATPQATVQTKPEIKIEPKPKVEPEKPAAKPAAGAGEKDDVMEAVNEWARAWSEQDMKNYLGAYSGDFQTPGGQPRKTWEEERRARIVGKNRINVRIETPQVNVNGNTATVKFRQIYQSDRLTANTRKTLVLTRQSGKWQIKQEQTGS